MPSDFTNGFPLAGCYNSELICVWVLMDSGNPSLGVDHKIRVHVRGAQHQAIFRNASDVQHAVGSRLHRYNLYCRHSSKVHIHLVVLNSMRACAFILRNEPHVACTWSAGVVLAWSRVA